MKTTFKIVAILEGLSYLILLFIATPIKYIGHDESWVKMFGMPHGLLFVAYVVLAFLVKPEYKWDVKTFLIVLAASVIPFGTFYVDKKYLRS